MTCFLFTRGGFYSTEGFCTYHPNSSTEEKAFLETSFSRIFFNIGRSFIIEKEKQGDLKDDTGKMRVKVRSLIDFQ